ncbi:MAG: TonB-dependent receptor [Bacteroidales bacterium]|nr:TonB-dependent receptor [Bacteroidales bacterium]
MRKRLAALFLTLSACAFAGPLWQASAAESSVSEAQQNQVTVTVLDETGAPVIQAGVMVVSTKTGGVTDLDGKATVQARVGDALEITFIGYETQTVTVPQSRAITVTLVPSSTTLEETVVVGYGTQKKESVVASIAQVNNETLRRTGNSTDLTEALVGQMPGLVSLTSSGEPGGILTGESSTNLYIRGQNTWNGGGPLILVDGVERNMNNVDVNEVERISILKDASATAVFGVKGANGVILITTKRGSEGKTRLNFNYTVSGKMLSKQPEKLDSYESMMIKNEAIEREVVMNEPSWNYYVPQRIINKFKKPQSAEYAMIYPNVDWEKEMFKDFALNTHHVTASAQGGSKKIQYFGSLSYLHEGDIFRDYDNGKPYNPNYNFDRMNFRSNIDFNVTNTTKLKINLAGFFSRKNTNWNNEGSTSRADQWMWSATYFLAPNLFIPRWPDGRWGAYNDNSNNSVNPLVVVYNIGLRQTRQTQLNADFHLEQDLKFITKGLKASIGVFYDNTIRSEGGVYDSTNSVRPGETNTNVAFRYVDYMKYVDANQDPSEYETLYPKATADYDWVPILQSRRYETILGANWAGYMPVYRRLMYQAQLDYARTFGQHNVTAMGVFKREEYARGSTFPSYREDWIGRVTYDYANRYLIELNAAYNGSEQFGPGYRFALFPSVALGWYLSNEPWFKVDWLNKVKFRYSLGKVGNDNVSSSRWLYQSQYAYSTAKAKLGKNDDTNSVYNEYRESSVGNPDVHWETATKQNFGLELSAWKDLITFSFDYFTEKRRDILMDGSARSIPIFYGATAASANLGKVNSRGYEFELGVNKQIGKDLLLWAKMTYNHNQNEILFRDDPQLQFSYLKQQGHKIGQTYNQISAGMYKNWDEVYASIPQENNDSQKIPGFFDVVDFNADGLIKASEDTPPVGYSIIPENTGSLSLGASWKGWNFMIQFYAVNNCNRYIGFNNFQSDYDVVFGHVHDYWSKDNPDGTSFIPRWKTSGEFTGDFYLYDASSVRLQTVELGYTFKNVGLLKKIHCDNLRLFVNGNNLLFWSDLPDDRSNVYSGGSATQGAYPTVKRVNFGIDLSF